MGRRNREWGNFVPAEEEALAKWERAMAHAEELAPQITEKFPDHQVWWDLCVRNLAEWAGEGLRLEFQPADPPKEREVIRPEEQQAKKPASGKKRIRKVRRRLPRKSN